MCSTIANGQVQSNSTKEEKIQKERIEMVVNFPETIQIKNTSKEPESTSSKMPWISALIIGTLSAIINLLVMERIRKSNEMTIGLQMTNAKELALSQFKATLGTKNRQDWIDLLRNSLSELISHSTMLRIELSSKKPNQEKIDLYFERMNYNKAKIELLINKDKTEQEDVMNAVYRLVSNSFDSKVDFNVAKFKEAENELMKASSILFTIHWQKIKSGFNNNITV
jgi:hypothetical protein